MISNIDQKDESVERVLFMKSSLSIQYLGRREERESFSECGDFDRKRTKMYLLQFVAAYLIVMVVILCPFLLSLSEANVIENSGYQEELKKHPILNDIDLNNLLHRRAPSMYLKAHVLFNGLRFTTINSILDLEETALPQDIHHHQPRSDCPITPSQLQGRMDLEKSLSPSHKPDINEFPMGGAWAPKNCSARHSVAIIIPFRDRSKHLHFLLSNLHPILQKQMIAYQIFVIEQVGNEIFNKGIVMNAGFLVALRQRARKSALPFHCFIFHDVDLLPEDDRNLYTCPSLPRHMSVAVNTMHYKRPYRELAGGVFAIRTEQFLRVNGYSNLYWGWGGEDDDMGRRVLHVISYLSRPPEWIARYSMLSHPKRKPLGLTFRKKLEQTWKRWRVDGLNTLQFRLESVRRVHGFTQVRVNIGKAPGNILKYIN